MLLKYKNSLCFILKTRNSAKQLPKKFMIIKKEDIFILLYLVLFNYYRLVLYLIKD